MVGDSPGKNLATAFGRRFSNWQIRLPRADLKARQRGEVRKAGWSIQYLFGRDERGEYVDVYSDHRMAGSDHFRLYADGECVPLPDLMQTYAYRPEIPGDEQRAATEFYEHNRRVAALLAEKRFSLGLNDSLRVGDGERSETAMTKP